MCSHCDAARKIINGELGEGDERRENIENLGLCYACVQNLVNYYLGSSVRHECAHCLQGYCDEAIGILMS